MIVPADGTNKHSHLMHTKEELAISGPALRMWSDLGEITPPRAEVIYLKGL